MKLLLSTVIGWMIIVVGVIGGGFFFGAKYSTDSAIEALTSRTIEVDLLDFEILPDVIEIEPHTDLTFFVTNIDDAQHDLKVSADMGTGRLKAGETATIHAGVPRRDFFIWCSIKGHREQGMEAQVIISPESS